MGRADAAVPGGPGVSTSGIPTEAESHRPWLAASVVAAVVVLAYLPYLSGIINTGVFGFNSGLATIPVGPWLGVVHGLPWIDPNVGFVSQALGHLAAMDLLHGHIAWWNPFEGVGVPLVGEGQSAVLFPFTLLIALPDGQLYFHLALQLIAGVATQRLLKEMGMARWVTIVGGILFALNGTFAWLTNAAFNPVAFLPVILWGIERCRHQSLRDSSTGWILVAIGLALSVYAGFPETAYIDGLLAAAWAVLRLVRRPRGDRAGFAVTVGLGAGVGLLVSAPFLAAFDSATRHADIGGHASAFAAAHLPLQGLSTLGLPYLYGPIDGFTGSTAQVSLTGLWGGVGGFVTAAVVAVALYGLFAGRDRGLRAVLAAWIAIALTKSFGLAPVVYLVNLIPAISKSAFSRYAPPSWELAFVVLAAIGLDAIGPHAIGPHAIEDGTATRSRRARTALALAGAATLAAVGAELAAGSGLLSALDGDPGFSKYPIAAVAWAVVTVVVLVVVGITARPAVAQLAMGLVLVVDGLVMYMAPELSAPTSQIPVDLRPVVYLQHHLGLYRFTTLGPIVPNYGSYFGIAEANAHDLPLPGRWADYVEHHLEPNELPQQFDGVTSLNPKGPTPAQELSSHLAEYEAIGVKYVVTPSIQGKVVPSRLVFHDRYTDIWELADPVPFYRVLSGSCRLHPISYDQLRATCATPSAVVRSELAEPGWTATANGKPVTLTRTGPLFDAVHLPAGTSEVTFNYLPAHMEPATAMFAGGLAIAAGAIAVPIAVRRRRKRSPPTRAAGPRHGKHAAAPERGRHIPGAG